MAKIGDVCASKIDTLNAAYNGKIDYIDISAVDNDKKKITNTETLQIKEAPSRARQLVECDDIIVSLVRPNLNAVAVVENSSENLQVASTGYCVLRCNQAVYSRYLFYFCQSETFINRMTAQATGASYPAVSNSIVKNCEIPLPERNKQKEIADILDKVTGLISLRKQQLAKLDELVKARFVEMFGDCKTNPKNWKTKALEKIANVGSSKRVFVEELQDSGIPFYRGTEIGALAEKKAVIPALFITEEHYKQLCETTGKPQKGDLLMPSICPDGRIWIVDTDEPFYFKDGRVLWVHLTSANYNSVFLLYTLKDRIMTDYASIASGTTFAELKIFALKKCKIFDVPLELQNQFANFVERVDQQKQTVQQSLEKLELMKKALMQEYFG